MSKRYLVFAATVIVLGLCAVGAMATPSIGSMDGSLADWGVTLAVDGSNKFVPSSFVPTSGVYVPGDNVLHDRAVDYIYASDPVGFRDHGGDLCDVEALYAAFDSTYAYFAVVTSANPSGTEWDGYGTSTFGPGDLKLVVGGVTYGIGARPATLVTTGDLVDHGVYGSYTGRQATTMSGTTAQVRNTPVWSWVDNPGSQLDAYFIAGTGTTAGTGTAAWAKQSISDTYYSDYWGHPQWRTYDTWVYEVAVLRSDIGSPKDGTTIVMSAFGVDCGNDVLSMEVVTPSEVVPEPLTAIFFGTGLTAVFGFVARRRMQKQAK